MSSKCNFCINKSQCSECDKGWKDKFIPSEDVRQYFRRDYVGVRGIDGWVYSWNSTNPDLIPTSNIDVGNCHCHCPYCGEEMFPIQGYLARGIDNYTTTGYCCICQGARDELEYNRKLEELKQRHEQELCELENQYKDKLKYCSDKLFDMYISKIKKNFKEGPYKYGYFSTLNGERYHSIKQFIK